MSDSDKVFAGSIPEIYDRLLVPLLFEPYARDLAERVSRGTPRDVLEIACGTGALTRAMAVRLASGARIVATDLNPPMLDFAMARQADDARIAWRQADAQSLPFRAGAFDVVACQFGAMFFPDKPRAYREARRVLRPVGRFLFNVWGPIADNEFADVVTEALAAVFPDDPPRFLARTPHGHHDPDTLRRDLAAAGFTSIAIDAVECRSRAATARDAAVAYCQGTPLRGEIEARGGSGLEAATEAAAEALARRFGNGPVDGRINASVISASI